MCACGCDVSGKKVMGKSLELMRVTSLRNHKSTFTCRPCALARIPLLLLLRIPGRELDCLTLDQGISAAWTLFVIFKGRQPNPGVGSEAKTAPGKQGTNGQKLSTNKNHPPKPTTSSCCCCCCRCCCCCPTHVDCRNCIL